MRVDLTLEDHAFMAGISAEMLDAVVQADLRAAFRAQVESYIGPWDWERDEPKVAA